MAKVIVTIKPNGTISVEAEGWNGPTCSTITKPYVQALGQEAKEELKPEFYAETTIEQKVTQ
jgi:hypothetical protein